MKILVVEDDPINQKLLVKILENRGFLVLTANDGIQAVELLALPENLEQISLIFMDCQMPNMDGFQTTVEIRKSEIPSIKKIPIYAISAHLDQSNKKKCIEVGMNGYVAKPYKPDEINAILAQLEILKT